MIGTTLGHYQITETLGAGGMGEVYRARDTKLERDVAIKVLPAEVAADHERLARFEREARLLASLNHANIASIYGLDEADGRQFIVMEVVEGETLEERVASSGPLEVDEVVDIARQVAVGLEAAHERGVIHRDLKPANIKITADGVAKILDFGLATGGGAVGDGAADGTDASNSPTMLAATGAGVIMGTAAYMSPEQAKGMAVDKRSDIWSFGVVLYEMLSGRKLFEAETVSDVLADVLRAPIDVAGLPAGTPARLRELVRRCLDRDPKARLRDIGEARVLLASPGLATNVDEGVRDGAIASGGRTLSRPLVALALLAGAAVVVVASALITRSLTSLPPVRVARMLDIVIDAAPAPGTALSADGTKLAYWRRGADLVVHDLVAGTITTVFSREDPTGGYGRPYWSPDGRELVFVSAGVVLAIDAGGADLRVVAEETRGGGTLVGWGPAGILLRSDAGIEAISASGGSRRVLIPAAEDWSYLSPPVYLADGGAVFVATVAGEEAGLYAWVDGQSKLLRTLSIDVEFPRIYYGGGDWLALDEGFRGDPMVWAVPFDARRQVSEGEPVRVLAGARSPTMSAEGALVYVDAEVFQSEFDVVWVDRQGVVQETVRPAAAMRPWGAPSVSPDGQRMALIVTSADGANGASGRVPTRNSSDAGAAAGAEQSRELLVYEFSTPAAPILMYAGIELDAVVGWFPDSRQVVVSLSDDANGLRLVALPLDGGAEPLSIVTAQAVRNRRRGIAAAGRPAMSAAGDRLTYVDAAGTAQMIAVGANGRLSAPQPLDGRLEPGVNPALSPDGRLAAVISGGSVQNSLALTRLPAGMPTFPLGANVRTPLWSRDGSELFFYQETTAATSHLMGVSIDRDSGRPTGAPRRLFPTTLSAGQFLMPNFDVSPTGDEFLMVLLRQPATRHVLIEDFDAFVEARTR